MAQHGFQMNGHGAGINPDDLTLPPHFGASLQHNYNSGSAFSSGSALFQDDELLEGLNSPTEPQGAMHGHGQQDFGTMNDVSMSYTQGIYGSHHGLPIDQHQVNGFSSTPDGDPIQSPFVHNLGQYRQMQHHQSFGGSLQSPLSYGGSPLANSDLNDNQDTNFLNAKSLPARVAQAMQRKPSNTRAPLTSKPPAMTGMSVPTEQTLGARSIGAATHHEKSHSGQWVHTPTSFSSFPGSGFSSPLQANLPSNQMNDILLKGASMPAKLGAASAATSSQEARRKRRRESHNAVERRRRDNINERIQDLSKLVPTHRLEDEKIKKAIASGAPLSPSLAGVSAPSQATSALAGPGARRAAGGTAGNITTGLPIEEKDKGPNKGDILNGAVSWMRDLMWMCHKSIQQQEELANALLECGGQLPFEITDDERRMQTELAEAMARIDEATGRPRTFTYSRTAGSGLRVPHHTDYKGEPLNGNGHATADHHASISPEELDGGHDILDLDYDDDGSGEVNFKEEDEYGMDLTH